MRTNEVGFGSVLCEGPDRLLGMAVMKPIQKSGLAWMTAIFALLAYEVWTVMNSAPGDTLSEAVWKYGQHPMVAFAAGVICGHFFWQRTGEDKP